MKGRYVVKIKIEEFSEFQYSENNFIKITDKDFNIKQMCLNNLTENRLNTAISKIGNFNENREEIFELLSEDILSEVNGFHVYELKEWLDQMIREKFKNGTTPFQII
uniref:RNA ligase 2 C-terminal domain-containing protein n=1 Tax=viral metagenome TaxID=1070528 RepID=A0A6C0AEH8_9ZZZZ